MAEVRYPTSNSFLSVKDYEAPDAKGTGANSSGIPTMAQPNVFQTIINAESGGRNVNNYMYDAQHTASGYFQITDSTWNSTAAGQASGVTHAMDAPFATQQAVAGELIQKNGLSDWAPYDHIDGNLSHYDTSPLTAPGGGTATPGAATGGVGTQSGAGFSSGAASGDDSKGAGDMYNPATTPIAITTTGKATNDQNKADTDALNKTSTANTKSITDTAKAAYASAHAALGDTLFRVVLIVIGAILLLGGLWIVASEQGAAPKLSTVAKKAGKAALVAA